MIFPRKSNLFFLSFSCILVVSTFLSYGVLLGNGEAISQPGMNTYATSPPGQTEKLDRPYQGAPPLIPHSVEGLGITRSGNDCLACHSEGIEIEKGHIATKVPPSHYVNEYTGQQMKEQVTGVRYNCLQCHVPQSPEEPPVLQRK